MDSDQGLLARLREFDDQRESLPGEHLFAIAAGALLLTRRSHSTLGWLLSRGLGAALVARGLSGRDGPIAKWRERQSADAWSNDDVVMETAETSPAIASREAAAGLQSVGQDWPAGASAKLAERTEDIDKGWH
ncbi:hypothetical protein [Aquabacterium sp. J223]|uniref:hypothetical protein n=1 Tax=Aquabacterium sp. J223 TaxID=2898431 RepID=UPI0021AD8B22|nr:hypothetical protein [Aquabacterium sp. J223]UUX95077.1 hypothetical protein LRS07_17820 [Aquabacterium sp. J223]